MERFHWLVRAFNHLFVKVIGQFLPGGHPLSSSYVDLFYGVFLSAVAVGVMQPISSGRADVSHRPAPKVSVAEAVERFAPEVRLHPAERYFPSSVDWYLKRAKMRSNVGDGGDAPTVAVGEWASTALPKVDRRRPQAGGRDDQQIRRRYFLQISNDARQAHTRRGALETASTYVHVRPACHGAAGYDIQYWVFFPYSGPMMGGPTGGAHEGDWEHVTVRVDEGLRQIEQVYFAAHDAEGRWVDVSRVRFNHDSHPVAYIGRSSHAMYPGPGLQARGMLPADQTADGGVIWRTWENVKIVANQLVERVDTAAKSVGWLHYPGRWGEVGALFSGPRGPAFQKYWSADE